MKHFLSAVVVLATLTGCAEQKETDTNFDNLAPLAKGVATADKVVLYEGLPHPVFEKKLLDAETKEKKTFEDHGFRFYAAPLDLKPADAKALTALFTAEGSFTKFGGEKKCGGFHPDYLVEWHAGKDVYRMQVCFGCGEVKVFGPRHELRADIGTDGFTKLLKPYRVNRPKTADAP